MREMVDALWEGQTLLKTGLSAHRHTHRQTYRHKSDNSISASFTPFTWRIYSFNGAQCYSIKNANPKLNHN